MIELTPEEQITKHYSACMDSVNLINAGKPTSQGDYEIMSDAEWAETVARNKEHLNIMLAKNIFDGFDVAPLQQAAAE
jgi:hypothetical protein